jgi:hypothetical protein
MRPILALPLIMLLATECQRPSSHSIDSATHPEQIEGMAQEQFRPVDDTALVFRLNGKVIHVHVQKRSLDEYSGFQELISQPRNRLTFTQVQMLDITGQGSVDSCVSSIELGDFGATITHLVISSGKQIWRDTLLLTDTVAFLYGWNEDSSYFLLKPYSTFKVAMNWNRPFVHDAYDTASEGFKSRSEYIYQNLTNGDPAELQYWKSRIGSFKGRILETIGDLDSEEYIWDGRHHKFVLCWSP